MNICYGASRYLSHNRVARVYVDIIKSRYAVTNRPENADIVILHCELPDLLLIYQAQPVLFTKYVIAYCVWEATELPEKYVKVLTEAQEVWTCSRYCYNVFSKFHTCVNRVPHAIQRNTDYSRSDLEMVKHAISHDPRCRYYLTVAKSSDKRKNTAALIRSFSNYRVQMPRARLIIKTISNDRDPPHISDPRIIHLVRYLSEAQMNALYSLADVYVSAHHAEGWGLGLSDAMIFGKPVIATGYSGNLEFMNDSNSFLVKYVEKRVCPDDCHYLFDTSMRWAYPDEDDLAQKMAFLYENVSTDIVRTKVENAYRDIQSFAVDAVARVLLARLAEVGAKIGLKRHPAR